MEAENPSAFQTNNGRGFGHGRRRVDSFIQKDFISRALPDMKAAIFALDIVDRDDVPIDHSFNRNAVGIGGLEMDPDGLRLLHPHRPGHRMFPHVKFGARRDFRIRQGRPAAKKLDAERNGGKEERQKTTINHNKITP